MNINNFDFVMLVVIYNKEVKDSNTIKTIINNNINGVRLVIHNNGPREISLSQQDVEVFSSMNIDFSLVNSISNKPLAVLYNDFIKNNKGYKKYVILDDDSELTESFVKSLNSDGYDLEVPKIISRYDMLTYYPLSDGVVVKENGIIKTKGTHSIGSGLIINHSLIDIFLRHNMKLFDENYALYGVDISLFRRMWKLTDSGEKIIINSSCDLLHSLSRVEGKENEFRRLERAMDFAISVRRYPTPRLYLSFAKKISINILNRRFKDIFLMLDCFFRGNHPRCRTWCE